MTDNKLEELKAQIAELAKQNNELTSIKSESKKERAELYNRIAEIEAQNRDIDNNIFDIRRKMREIERELQAQEKRVEQEEANKRAREEFQRLSAMFDEEMAKYHWSKEVLPHQVDGAKKLAIAQRGILGDKRGLGKTLTAVAWTDLIGAKKILAIVPNDVMGNFEREIRYWAPHRTGVQILGGHSKLTRNFMLDLIKDVDETFCIINYEAWRKDLSLIDRLAAVQFDTVIVDEAHNIKDPSAIASRGVRDIVYAENQCPECGHSKHHNKLYTIVCDECKYESKEFGDFCSVKRVLPMTGTPILNKPQDFYSLLHLVDRQQFHSQRQFLDMYCVQDYETGKWRFVTGGVERLTTKLSGLYVARDRNQAGVKIPKQTIQVHNLELDPTEYPRQFDAYQTLSAKAALVMDDLLSDEGNKANVGVFHAIALITRERQMITWPAGIEFNHPITKVPLFKCDVDESIKIDKAMEMIKQFVEDEGERVVLFSQFKGPLVELEKRLQAAQISCVRYDGDTDKEIAQQVQIDFDRRYAQEGYKWDVVLANYKKGGVGLNFNAATQTIFLDEEWNPGKEDQAGGRTDRMGQTEETTVHILRVKNTIDEWMAQLIQEKAAMIEGFELHADLQQQLWDIIRKGA